MLTAHYNVKDHYNDCQATSGAHSWYHSDRFKKHFSHHQPADQRVLRFLVTVRKRSLGQGNIFTPVCYSVQGGGTWAGTPHGRHTPWQVYSPGQVHPAWQLHTPGQVHPLRQVHPQQCMLEYGQQAGGTYPTGMHSC